MNIITNRDQVEAKLLNHFKDHLHPLDETWIPAINAHKDGTHGFSY